MSKTKEVEGYIYEYHAPWIDEGVSMPFLPAHGKHDGEGPRLKAKLIIELPEKKVTISESEFDEAIGEIDSNRCYLYVPAIGMLLKEKLFGKEG